MMAAERIERIGWLDRLGDPLQRLVNTALRGKWVRDVLHGVWLGHPLHPVLVQAPVGAWLGAAVLDVVPGQRRAATILVAAGTVTALPAAIAGANDWASLAREQRRVGVVHAVCNSAALVVYGCSLTARLRGRHGTGRIVSFAALGLAATGAYLGGHLSYRQAAGVNHAAPGLRLLPDGWQTVGDTAEFSDGAPAVRHIGEVPVLVFRQDGRYTVLLEHCAHQGGPLGQGSNVDVEGEQCVVCPWHGSTFRLADGSVVHGPAASNQPALAVRVNGGRLEVRRP